VKRISFTLLLSALATACGEPPTVEQQITAEIRAMETEIEAGERLNFMRHVAADFRGQGGAMSRDELRAYVVLQFNRYKNLEARLFPITVAEIDERQATADFKALLTGGPNWIPEDGQLYQIRTHWRLEDDTWLLVAAYWEPAPLGDLIE
jgi:hypothetical protein